MIGIPFLEGRFVSSRIIAAEWPDVKRKLMERIEVS